MRRTAAPSLVSRAPLLALLMALAFLLKPGAADAKVFQNQQELDNYWKTEVEVPMKIFKDTFNDSTMVSREDVGKFDAGNPATGQGLQVLYDNSPARIYKGLQAHALNAMTLTSSIPPSRASVIPVISKWVQQCNRYNEVVKLIVDTLAPLQKKTIDLAYAKDPARDYTDAEIFGVLVNDVNWFSQGGGGVYIGTPISLLGSMIGDSYWTDDRDNFGHPCVYAWMIAVVASRPDTSPNPKNTFSYWENGRDAYLDFESVYIPANLCQAKGMDFCYPRAYYTSNFPLPADGAMETNIGLTLNRIHELIKKYDDQAKANEAELDALKKAAEEKARQDALLKARILGSGSALSLPLPLSDISIEGVIGRVINALLGIVGAIALLMFVWGGVTWMTAAGSQERVAKAKKTITWAAIGLLAIFGSYAILNLVIKAFTTK